MSHQQWKLICRMLGWKQHRRNGSGANISPLLTDRVLFLPPKISRPGGEILAWGLFTKDSLLYPPSSHHQEHQNYGSATIFSYFSIFQTFILVCLTAKQLHSVYMCDARYLLSPLSDETKKFHRDRYRDFFWEQIFRDWYRDFFWDQMFSRPIPRLFFETKCLRDWYWDFFWDQVFWDRYLEFF